MRKQYDDFTQMKLKDMCKNISDMTYTYINPETQQPTKVPADTLWKNTGWNKRKIYGRDYK